MKKALKRSLSLLLAITIIFGSMYIGLSEVDFGGLFAVKAKAASSGTCGTNVTWTLDDGAITISGTGDMKNFNTSSIPWRSQKTNITSVVIDNGVTSIGNYAFYGCSNLETVTIPDSVTSIGNYAFRGCSSLTSIAIPDGLTSIGSFAFRDCAYLTTITIPDSATSIEVSAFYNTGYYNDSSNWENDVLYIGNHLIEAKTTLSGEYAIKEGTKTIVNKAFYDCSSLTSITIPGTVTSIGNSAFYNCISLSDVYYGGTEVDWTNIDSNNSYLTDATIHYHEHSYSEWIVDVEPTCTEAGSKHNTCLDCGKLVTEEIPPITHNYGDWIIITEPTCTKAGEAKKVCSVCSYTLYSGKTDIDSNLYPESTHNYRNNISETYNFSFPGADTLTLTFSSSTYIVSNDYLYIYTKTGTQYGKYTGLSLAKETITLEGDSFTIKLTSDYDYVGYGFSFDSIVAEVTPDVVKPRHNYSTEWTIDYEPTCTEDGSKSHHCTACEDKADVTVITATGHSYEITDVISTHPYTIQYECIFCEATKTETTSSLDCVECNFTIAAIDANSYKLVSFIGTETEVVIPSTYNGRAITTVGNSCFKGNTTITSVEIAEGVTTIGSLVFMNCSSLEKVVIPASVTSIGAQAFYGFTGIIYCTNGSFAHNYAITNNIKYVLLSIKETENTKIDYENLVIHTSVQGCADISGILGISETTLAISTASYVYGNLELYGTGTIITVFDGDEYIGDFTLVVEGDTNGDSICDALDAMQVGLVSNGHRTIDGAYALAADSNADDVVDVNDYQAIVNKAVS